jgi:hypothetical protein
VRCAAQNHIALRIEQALVTTLAVLKPCIGGLELPRKLGQLLGSPGKILGLSAQRKKPQQQKSEPTCHDAAQEQRIEQHQAAVPIEVCRRGAPKRHG